MARLAYRFPRLARIVEGTPTVLIEDGRILVKNLKREVMTQAELARALRHHALDPDADLPRIKRAYLEGDGTVTVILKDEGSQDTDNRHSGKLPKRV